MRRSFFTLLFLFTGFLALSENNRQSIVPKDITNSIPFSNGEKLTYVVKYKWGAINSEVGEVKLETTTGSDASGETFFVTANGFTYKFYDIFFKVRDYYESRFTSDLRPIYFHRDIKEGKYTMKNYIYFNPDNKIKAIYQRVSSPVKDTVFHANPETFDIISMVYNLRGIDFGLEGVGTSWNRSVVIDGKIIRVTIRHNGKAVKIVQGLGKFDTIVMSVSMDLIESETFKRGDMLMIWITDDKNRIPVQIESPIKVGSVIARLAALSGLKYPLTSKLQ